MFDILLDPSVHMWAVWAMCGTAALTAVSLLWLSAPYGRHGRGGWGPEIPSRVGWILMELPAVVVWLGFYAMGAQRAELVSLVLLGMWQTHYVHRTFIFPFRMRADGKTMPASIAGMAIFFNVWNAYINALWVSHFGSYAVEWLFDPRFLVGAALFFVGMGINIWADSVLMRLRAPGQTDYKIPRGGLYERITCPNYFGEILEWTGWAIATWSWAGLAFALYTAANIGPRALSHQRWYKQKFPDYPPDRKALIPFVL
jgi:protein-S-isoprenylcysteine O-methyltransferase Ste14